MRTTLEGLLALMLGNDKANFVDIQCTAIEASLLQGQPDEQTMSFVDNLRGNIKEVFNALQKKVA